MADAAAVDLLLFAAASFAAALVAGFVGFAFVSSPQRCGSTS
jgi:hypothetical protein